MTCDQQRFERDVAKHEMTIIRDDGVDRHIKFRNPEESPYWFEILTWPGALCIRGDCGTYVFSRLTDMFQFFRTDRGRDPAKLYINEGYWCEKLQAVDCNGYGNGRAQEFSGDRFAEHVKRDFESYFESRDVSAERKAEIWQEIQDYVLDYVGDGYGLGHAGTLLRDHEPEDFPRMFEDVWEWHCDEYTFRFLWNLYAIARAIRKYDAAKAVQPAEVA